MPKSTKRLAILNEQEIQELFHRPVFSAEDQEHYFSLAPDEQLLFESLRHTRSRLLFLLQLGYFKASRRFFVFSWASVQTDLIYLCQRYFPKETAPTELPDKKTRIAQQKMILHCQNYRAFGPQDRSWLLQQANQLIRIHAEPRFLLTELLNLLENRRTTIPGYSTFQKIIAEAIQQEQQRLMQLIAQLPDAIKTELAELLQREEGHLSRLTALKKRAKDFSLKETRQEIQKHTEIHSLYQFAYGFLPTLDLSNENIHHYASLAEYYPVNRLLAMPKSQSQLYLLCFIQHCFEQISDNLITCFIFLVNSATQEAIQTGKERLAEYHQANQQQLTKTRKLIQFFIDPDIDDEQPFKVIKQQVFAVVDEDRIQKMLDYLSGKKLSRQYYEWEYIHQQARKTTLNIRPLLMALDFGSTAKDDPILVAANQLKMIYQTGKSSLPPEFTEQINHFLPKKLQPYVQQSSQYAFFIFQKLRESLDAGDIHFKGSTRFKSFEEDLVSIEELQDKQSVLDAMGYPLLSVPMKQRLSEPKQRLEQRYREVNANIRQGKNPHLKITRKDNEITWRLPYKKQEDQVNNPFYEQLPQADIINILQYVDQQVVFLKHFRHIQPRYAKSPPDHSHILACLVAHGERVGLHSMADMSDIKDHLLRTTAANYIRPETLRKANDGISNAIAQLPLFQHYDLELGSLHASADGQKFEAQHNTFKARYSRKYFGLNKGLVNYTLVANHVPINARLIGANEHESHYAFDIVFNNTSDIHPDIISTDMAGTNQVNFALLETFGRTWAPRYTQVNRKASRLVGFKPSGSYPEEDIIKPSAQVSETLILAEAENLHRIFASMALKTTTQANLVRKLSSYARKNRTKKALWELDNIYMSLYLLDYIDNIEFRRDVQRALNRGEAYHQLQRAITHPNGGRFRGTTDHDMAIESECSRLLANAIIYYNMDMLSQLWQYLKSEGRFKEAEQVKRLSPVAWRHINLFGRYEFYGNHPVPDVGEIIRNIRLV